MAFKFEQLEVWQRSVELSGRVHDVTSAFPREELYVLTSQIQRAADSIALNVAEGSTGQTNGEFKQFLGYAIRSALEVVTCLYLGKKRSVISEEQFQGLYHETESIVRMPQALRKSVRA